VVKLRNLRKKRIGIQGLRNSGVKGFRNLQVVGLFFIFA
jgi:hypothetical protein